MSGVGNDRGCAHGVRSDKSEDMTEIDGGRIAAKQLVAAGIDTVFGVVAGPMIELFAGAQAEGLKVVGCRHEESAAFMASAWGWTHRKPGVVIVGSGPAMTNTVTSMHVATASAMPLVVLGGSDSSVTTNYLPGMTITATGIDFERPVNFAKGASGIERKPG